MKRTWLGVIIIIIGLGFLLEQMDVIPFVDLLAKGWPLIIIFIGVLQLSQKGQTVLFTGSLFIVVGVIFLLSEWTDFNLFTYVWPLFIIYVGFIFIFYRAKDHKHIDEEHVLDSVVVFSGSQIKSRSNPLEGGSVMAVFGGSEIDLSEAVVVDEKITIDITSVFGGVEIRVPEEVHVQITGIPIFGGWEDKTRYNRDESDNLPVIHFKCVTIFGGLEVKN